MRELKFRAWDYNNKEMLYMEDLRLQYEDCSMVGLEDIFDTEMWEFMQYTGLKDKNGVEIYEGDMVVIDFSGIKEEYIVGYDKSWAAFIFRNEKLVTSLELAYANDEYFSIGSSQRQSDYPIEVIGNIYENPLTK